MIKQTAIVMSCLLVVTLGAAPGDAGESRPAGSDPSVVPQWRLAIQTASFKPNSLTEAIGRVRSLGVKHVELHAYRSLSPGQPDVPFDYTATAELRQTVKTELKRAGIELVSYFFQFKGDEAELRRMFVFAKQMGVETMVGEPTADNFELLDRLANEFEINVAIHNHPRRPNKPDYRFWDPDEVAKIIAGRSKRIGVCPDVGHWARSGVKPVEGLKKFEGRILTLHLKDVEGFTTDARGVPLGTGVVDVRGVLGELVRQGFSGVISIEHEEGRPDNQTEVAQCVKSFRRLMREFCP